jgi:hypothetical protein
MIGTAAAAVVGYFCVYLFYVIVIDSTGIIDRSEIERGRGVGENNDNSNEAVA